MGDTDKKEEIEKEEKKSDVKYKIGTIGNFFLIALIVLILGTGGLTYYLIHSAKNDYDKQYNELVSEVTTTIQNQENITKEPETIANMIDGAIANVTATNSSTVATNTVGTDSKKILNEQLIVLYNGLVLDVSKMDEVELKYIDNHSDEKDKYIITYYSYENYAFQESKLGSLSEQVYEGLVKVENVGKVAISEDYNAIPREVKVVNTIPTIISDNNPTVSEYDTVKTLIVDTDGNGLNEYILILANKQTGFSKIVLFDSKGAKVADLASIEKSKWDSATNEEYYLSISNIEIIDIDNDGIMEILIEIPRYEGDPTISLLKYKNGELQGKTAIECSLLP